jgi:hypothetical protein
MRAIQHTDMRITCMVSVNLITLTSVFFLGSLTETETKEDYDFVSGVKMASSAPGETRGQFGTRATYTYIS